MYSVAYGKYALNGKNRYEPQINQLWCNDFEFDLEVTDTRIVNAGTIHKVDPWSYYGLETVPQG